MLADKTHPYDGRNSFSSLSTHNRHNQEDNSSFPTVVEHVGQRLATLGGWCEPSLQRLVFLRCGLYFFHTTNSERRAPPEKEKKSHFESTSKKKLFFSCFWPDVSTDQGRDQLTRSAQLRCQNRGQKNIIKPDRLWRVSNGKKTPVICDLEIYRIDWRTAHSL